jgi:hypothetical protein
LFTRAACIDPKKPFGAATLTLIQVNDAFAISRSGGY